MFKKYIMALSLMFAFGYANAMGDAAGFMGAFELEHNLNKETTTYNAQVGWAGEVNSMVNWKVELSTNLDQSFKSGGFLLSKDAIRLSQAYVSYMPMDSFMLMAGRKAMGKKGLMKSVIFDEDLYTSGIWAKYNQDMGSVKWHAMLGVDQVEAAGAAPFKGDTLVSAMVAVMSDMGDFSSKAYVMATYDGLLNDDVTSSDADPDTLVTIGLQVSSSSMEIPVSISGNYSSDPGNLDDKTYTVGVEVGKAGMKEAAANDFSLTATYYAIDSKAWINNFVDTEYGLTAGTDAKGIAVKAQYNVFDNTSAVIKYAHDLDATDKAYNVVGKLLFNF